MTTKPKDLLTGVLNRTLSFVSKDRRLSDIWVKLTDINSENCNWGRFRGVKTTGVQKIRTLIQTGQYDPIHYEPQ